MSFISTAYAMGAQPGGGQENMFASLMPFILIFAVFYFLLIRPQQKRAKEHQAMLAGLKKGDAVITNGGILGRIIEVKDDYMVVDIGETKVNIPRNFLNPAPQKKTQAIPAPKKEKKGKKGSAKEEAAQAAAATAEVETVVEEQDALVKPDAEPVVSGNDTDKPAVQ